MNDHSAVDEKTLRQIERALEQGRSVDDPLINQLTQMRPKADPSFQKGLEQVLLGQLDAQTREGLAMNGSQRQTSWLVRQRRPLLASAALLVALSALVFGLMVQPPASPQLAAVTPIDPSAPVVVAAQDIAAGTTITGDMLAIVTLSELDRQALRQSAPMREFITDPQTVIGEKAAIAIGWFQPIIPAQLGEPAEPCRAASCLPDGYYQIGVPMPADGARGLAPGDRVDVLAFMDDQIREIVSNVLLVDLTESWAMLAAPSWQQGVLVPWSNDERSVALRLHVGSDDAPVRDDTPVEYTFIAPETLPEDFRFDLIVNVPASRGYQLVDLPAPIEDVQFTSNGDTLHFWFTDLEVVRIGDALVYTVQPGDTLLGLAATLGLSVGDVAALNGSAIDTPLQIGSELIIQSPPDGSSSRTSLAASQPIESATAMVNSPAVSGGVPVTAVTIRLAKSDAENLAFLIEQGMDLTFNPDAG